ncbi:short chain dehydrogenase [Fusarium subglutinans]|uniref:Short chain dehydrogenase n=1 Tax=Gibberella subglutinans TaxID=42677 RepID=A0A8H5KJJ1_GIBSU|nr:short chain dehydrogenase [Fusarium subglutinans]KAF5575007.1 short chain dehydrogenase [Fusarium subglutinans]
MAVNAGNRVVIVGYTRSLLTRESFIRAGANRGIGLNLARSLASRGWNVTGTVRPQTLSDPSVNDLKQTGARVLALDFLDEDSIKSAAQDYGRGPLDVLVNCAGTGPEPDDWHQHTAAMLMEKFHTNTIQVQGPFLTTKYFYPNLKLGSGRVYNLSSRGASISNNIQGQDLAYRLSKTALNQLTATMAAEFKNNGDGIAVIAVYPGYVATRLSSFRSRDNMEECIEGVVRVIETTGMSETGSFVNWKGETMPCDEACCIRAREENSFVSPNNGSTAPLDDIVCGQVYNESSPAAPDAYITYNFCKSECSGWGVSSVGNADQWAGPIVQFILPSVIFSMNIPRGFEFVSSQWLDILVLGDRRGWQRVVLSLLITFPALLFVAADTIIWVMTSMCMAGPMMVVGLHEALLDFKILRALKRKAYIPERVFDGPRVSEEIPLDPMGHNPVRDNVEGTGGLRDKVELLVTVLAGNLRLKTHKDWPDNLVLISNALLATGRRRSNAMASLPARTPQDLLVSDNEYMLAEDEINQHYPSLSEQLKRLMTAQSAFGAIVGAAVVFYLGAFIYTILDLLGDKSNRGAAISLAFGVEWMIIVHVAIVNGFLLASNNPSPATMLIGRRLSTLKPQKRLLFPPIYDGILQPVFMWRQGVNKMQWLETSRAWRRGDEEFMKDVQVKLYI